MPRPKNPRRAVLPVLRAIKSNATAMTRVWGSPRVERDPETKHWGRAPDAEQPENTPADWDRLAEYMAIIARQAKEVEQYANKQATRLRAWRAVEGE